MENKQMYFYLMIVDLVMTAVLEMWANSGMKAEEVTKEVWIEMSAASVERRKAAMAKIKSQ